LPCCFHVVYQVSHDKKYHEKNEDRLDTPAEVTVR